MQKLTKLLGLGLLLIGLNPQAWSQDVKIKDLVSIRGQRTNSLIGFGLVIGLNKTGDSPASLATNKAISTLLTRLGTDPGAGPMLTRATAAVVVTADLPSFAHVGDKLNVKVSTIGDAISLYGGTLLMTPLKAGDGQFYAVAEGNILSGQGAGEATKSMTTAFLPSAAYVERDFKSEVLRDGSIDLSLRSPDFTTSHRVSQVINAHFRHMLAEALDASHIKVRLPEQFESRVTAFIAELEGLSVVPDQKAVVIINERTGTVVMGGEVRLSEVVVSHNGLSIAVGSGKDAKQESLVPIQGPTIAEFVKGLNQMGVKPGDLVSILQSIHASGALKAELRTL